MAHVMYGLHFIMLVIALPVFVRGTGQPVISIFNGTRCRQSGHTWHYIFCFRSEPPKKEVAVGRNTQALCKRFFRKTGRASFFSHATSGFSDKQIRKYARIGMTNSIRAERNELES